MPAFSGSAANLFHSGDRGRPPDQFTIPNSVVRHLQLDSGAIVALNVAYGMAGDSAQIVPGQPCHDAGSGYRRPKRYD